MKRSATCLHRVLFGFMDGNKCRLCLGCQHAVWIWAIHNSNHKPTAELWAANFLGGTGCT